MKLRRVERRRLAGTVCCLFLLGCSGGDPDPDATGDAAGDGGFNVGNVDGGGVDATIPDPPQNIDPCQATECREGTLGGPPCATFTTDDDFSGGEFGVHGYTSMAWDGADTTIRVDSRGGDWTPILILARLNGEVLFDGDVGAVRPPFEVVATTQADIVVSTVQATGIVVYVTSAEAITTDFQDIPPTDAAYTLSIDSNCGGERLRCFVNGSDTGQPECGWLHYVGKRVITRLEGARDQRLSTAARVTWWSLKEGLLDLDNPIVQSRCGAGDLGPLESCSQSTWRVGLADVDVDGSDIVALEDLASRLYDGAMVSGVLRTTANEAGLDREEAAAVMDSQGELRNSWLLRNSAVGFTIAERGVTAGCIDMAGADCYGTNTAAKRLYAPDRAGALRSIDDLQALFDLMAE